jgi:hypothetical protein
MTKARGSGLGILRELATLSKYVLMSILPRRFAPPPPKGDKFRDRFVFPYQKGIKLSLPVTRQRTRIFPTCPPPAGAGGGCLYLFNEQRQLISDTRQILQNFIICKPYDLKACPFEIGFSFFVSRCGFFRVMCNAVNFNNQRQFFAEEIGNVLQNRSLSSKLIAFERFFF